MLDDQSVAVCGQAWVEPALFRELFMSPPPIGESSAALKEGCSVALAGYIRHYELRVNDFTLGQPYV